MARQARASIARRSQRREAARRQREQLGPVAQPVVGGERPPVQAAGTRSWISVRASTFFVPWPTPPRNHIAAPEPADEPGGRQAEADALHGDGHQERRRPGTHATRRETTSAPETMPTATREDQAVDGVADLEVLLEEEDLRSDGRAHEQQRDERTDMTTASVRSRKRKRSRRARARRPRRAAACSGWRRARSNEAASASGHERPALTSIAASIPPNAARTPPSSGPAVMPE